MTKNRTSRDVIAVGSQTDGDDIIGPVDNCVAMA